MKAVQNKRSLRRKKQRDPVEGSKGFPNNLRKDGCLYINGVIEAGAHGIYHIALENGMASIATARRMESLKLSLLPGDNIVAEIPAYSLNPNEKINSRIVWRHKEKS